MTPTYQEKINWTLDQKVLHFYEVVSSFITNLNGKTYVSFSGGKDSTVMKFLIEKLCAQSGLELPKFVFNNTTNEHKEILDFVKSFGDDIIWLKPKMTFAQVLVKYGFPLVSKEQSMAVSRYKNTKSEAQKKYRLTGIKPDGTKGVVGVIRKKWQHLIDAPFNVTERCCDILKKEPVKRFEKETGLRPIIGTMAEESNSRRLQYLKDGCIVWSEGKESCKPLSIFTEDDIWALIEKFNIEISTIYKDQIIDGVFVTREKRTGCAYCAFGCHLEPSDNNRFTRLYKREPKRYKSFMDKLGYRQALNYIGIQLPDEKKQYSLNLK